MAKTALAEQLEKHFDPIEIEALKFYAKWLNHGRSQAQLFELLTSYGGSAGQKSSDNHLLRVSQPPELPQGKGLADHCSYDAQPRPVRQADPSPEIAGHKSRDAQTTSASEEDRGGTDHPATGTQGPSVRPVREPSKIQNAASAKVMREITVLDTYKVKDGRAIGDVRFGEIERLRAESAQDALLLRQIQRYAANASPNDRVRDVVKLADFQRMQQKAAELADAA